MQCEILKFTKEHRNKAFSAKLYVAKLKELHKLFHIWFILFMGLSLSLWQGYILVHYRLTNLSLFNFLNDLLTTKESIATIAT